jgi:hypothetical protein
LTREIVFLAIGDDKINEDLLRTLLAQTLTFKIKISATLAKYNLKDQQQVSRIMDRMLETGS